MKKDSNKINKLESDSIINNENNNDINVTSPVNTKKSKWSTGTIIVLIVAIALVIGVIFVLKQDMEKQRNQLSSMYGEYEDDEITSIIGEWYAYDKDSEEFIVFHFKNRNQCKIIIEDVTEKCSYRYDDDIIKIYGSEDSYLEYDAEYVEFKYELHSSYLEITIDGESVKFYSSKSKAEKNPSTPEKTENNDNGVDSIDKILKTYSREEFVKICENIDYNSLARTPDNYKGKYIHFKGEVIQVQEDTTEKLAVLRVNTKLSDYDYIENYYEDDTVYVVVYNYDMNNRILEEDIIDMYGIYYGIETYETVLGSSVSIPAMVTLYYSID